jgi:diketogulonate reductase-like aldo/keto reductase
MDLLVNLSVAKLLFTELVETLEPNTNQIPINLVHTKLEVMFTKLVMQQDNIQLEPNTPLELNMPLEPPNQLMFNKLHKLSTQLLTLENKSLKEKAESNTFHSKRKSSNTRMKLESKEFQKLEKLPNTENKRELKLFQEKSPKLTIMPLNI